jgi:hypothetical protein
MHAYIRHNFCISRFKPGILATQEMEIRRIKVGGQPGQKKKVMRPLLNQ